MITLSGFDFAGCLEYNSICTVLVKRRAAFHSLEPDYACMVRVECIDPPTEEGQQVPE
jgi:hypothetical protein